mmetsp:Transcript_19645/g.59241  ORF Transcript_19645/g.59241 Transcript_19645/m.59241 type:complete len:229 (+) Transcript_19645:503-1189(+)
MVSSSPAATARLVRSCTRPSAVKRRLRFGAQLWLNREQRSYSPQDTSASQFRATVSMSTTLCTLQSTIPTSCRSSAAVTPGGSSASFGGHSESAVINPKEASSGGSPHRPRRASRAAGESSPKARATPRTSSVGSPWNRSLISGASSRTGSPAASGRAAKAAMPRSAVAATSNGTSPPASGAAEAKRPHIRPRRGCFGRGGRSAATPSAATNAAAGRREPLPASAPAP